MAKDDKKVKVTGDDLFAARFDLDAGHMAKLGGSGVSQTGIYKLRLNTDEVEGYPSKVAKVASLRLPWVVKETLWQVGESKTEETDAVTSDFLRMPGCQDGENAGNDKRPKEKIIEGRNTTASAIMRRYLVAACGVAQEKAEEALKKVGVKTLCFDKKGDPREVIAYIVPRDPDLSFTEDNDLIRYLSATEWAAFQEDPKSLKLPAKRAKRARRGGASGDDVADALNDDEGGDVDDIVDELSGGANGAGKAVGGKGKGAVEEEEEVVF